MSRHSNESLHGEKNSKKEGFTAEIFYENYFKLGRHTFFIFNSCTWQTCRINWKKLEVLEQAAIPAKSGQKEFEHLSPPGQGGGGGTPIYGLYRHVPRNRVWFLRFSVAK